MTPIKNRLTRRKMLGASAATLAGGALAINNNYANALTSANSASAAERGNTSQPRSTAPLAPGKPGKDYTPLITPNNSSLEWKIVNGVKVYHLVAEPVFHEFTPGLKAHCWGYNGNVPGPTIEATEGDRVRIYVTNKLPVPTTVHWHGILLPNGMDGVSGVTQPAIPPGQTFRYEFTLRQHGTYMYHSHHNVMIQEGMGLNGMFIIHPRPNKHRPRIDRDFAIMLHEWKITPGAYRPDPYEMTDFNVFTMNARCYPGTNPLVVEQGQRVRIRIGNLSAMDHHPIHLHGYEFPIVATDGGDVPEHAQTPHVTTLVPVGSTRDIEFIADNPGDWVMHCHMSHHVMNQMGHDFPNMVGFKSGGLDKKIRNLLPSYMTMGPGQDMGSMQMPTPPNTVPMYGGPGHYGLVPMAGMFTIFKVREHLSSKTLKNNQDPGWYRQPKGTEVKSATEEQMRRDGIKT